MGSFIIQTIIGLFLIIVGIFNTKGDISSLHSYHRKRVKKEDILPFGKKVGLGSIKIGISIIIAGTRTLLSQLLDSTFYIYLSNITLAIGLTIGTIIISYALFKYNKGIF